MTSKYSSFCERIYLCEDINRRLIKLVNQYLRCWKRQNIQSTLIALVVDAVVENTGNAKDMEGARVYGRRNRG